MPSNGDRRDEERTRSQMILDVNAFSQDAQSLGIDVLSSEVFNSLHAMVHADLIEGELQHLIHRKYNLSRRILSSDP